MRFTLFVLLAGCSGDEADSGDTDTDTDTVDTDTTPTGETGTVPDVYDPTWAGVQELFVAHCDGCHPSEQGIDLHVEVETPSSGYPYVLPGDPDNSYLWQVVSGGAMIQMPLGQGLLPAETVQCIHDWIEAGAVFD